jgi:hypothetical protein
MPERLARRVIEEIELAGHVDTGGGEAGENDRKRR